MTRTTRLAGIAVAGALALAACASEPPKTPATTTAVVPPTSATTTTSAPPTSTTPAEDPQIAAARALLDRYFATYNKAVESGVTTEHRTTFTPACGLCLSSAATIDGLAKEGKRISGGAFTLSEVTVYDAKHLVLQAKLQQAAATVKSSQGATVKTYPATKPSYSLFHFKVVNGLLLLDRIVA